MSKSGNGGKGGKGRNGRNGSDGSNGGLSADDLALLAGVVVVIGDILALWSIIAAKREDEEEVETEQLAALSSRRGRKRR